MFALFVKQKQTNKKQSSKAARSRSRTYKRYIKRYSILATRYIHQTRFNGARVIMLGKPLLIDSEVAKITKFSVSSVRKWRVQGRGPLYLRLGNSIRYKEQDVLHYVQSGKLYSETGLRSKRSIKDAKDKRSIT